MTRAFLIGAGATKAQYEEAPLSNDFFLKLKQKHPELYDNIEETLRDELNEYLFSIDLKYQAYLKDSQVISEELIKELKNKTIDLQEKTLVDKSGDIWYLRNEGTSNYRLVITPTEIEVYALKYLKNYNIEDLLIKSEQYTDTIKERLMRYIFQSLYQLIATTTKSNIDIWYPGYHKIIGEKETLFETLIQSKKLKETDFFMTLNYDLYLDREIYRNKRVLDYGLTEKFIDSKPEWLKIDEIDKYSIYHLHGSLNWRFSLTAKEKIVISSNAIVPQVTQDQCDLCIIAPGKKKLFPILETIWEKAENRLDNANELIIIGCSLNPLDNELIELIKSFLVFNKHENIKIISKCTKDSEEYQNYVKMIGDGFKFYPYGLVFHGPRKNEGVFDFIFK